MYTNLINVSNAYINEDSFGSEYPEFDIIEMFNDLVDNHLTHYDYNGNEDADGNYVDRDDVENMWEMSREELESLWKECHE